ncbi:MAG: DUF423 domain-containing protein [Candidatus Hermodarchaeota archaeon]
MTERNYWLILGAILAAIGVSAGAAGSHLLQDIISEARFITFNKAVRYQVYHSFALIFVALLSSQNLGKALDLAGWLFLAGILLFSGSLYLIVLTGLQWFEIFSPFGGIAFVLGWLSLAYSAFQNKK